MLQDLPPELLFKICAYLLPNESWPNEGFPEDHMIQPRVEIPEFVDLIRLGCTCRSVRAQCFQAFRIHCSRIMLDVPGRDLPHEDDIGGAPHPLLSLQAYVKSARILAYESCDCDPWRLPNPLVPLLELVSNSSITTLDVMDVDFPEPPGSGSHPALQGVRPIRNRVAHLLISLYRMQDPSWLCTIIKSCPDLRWITIANVEDAIALTPITDALAAFCPSLECMSVDLYFAFDGTLPSSLTLPITKLTVYAHRPHAPVWSVLKMCPDITWLSLSFTGYSKPPFDLPPSLPRLRELWLRVDWDFQSSSVDLLKGWPSVQRVGGFLFNCARNWPTVVALLEPMLERVVTPPQRFMVMLCRAVAESDLQAAMQHLANKFPQIAFARMEKRKFSYLIDDFHEVEVFPPNELRPPH